MDKEKANKRKSNRYCIVYGCMNTDKTCPDQSFFSLPESKERRVEWLKAIGRDDLLKIENIRNRSYVVCESHFDQSMIKTVKLLKSNAVPVLELPSSNNASNSENQREPIKTTAELPVVTTELLPLGEEKPKQKEEVVRLDSDSNSDCDSEPIKTKSKIPVATVQIPPMDSSLAREDQIQNVKIEISDSDSNSDSDSSLNETEAKIPVTTVEVTPVDRSATEENRKRKMVLALEASKKLMNWETAKIPYLSTSGKEHASSSKMQKK